MKRSFIISIIGASLILLAVIGAMFSCGYILCAGNTVIRNGVETGGGSSMDQILLRSGILSIPGIIVLIIGMLSITKRKEK